MEDQLLESHTENCTAALPRFTDTYSFPFGWLRFTPSAALREVSSIETAGPEAQKHRLQYVCACMVSSTFIQKQVMVCGELSTELSPELKCRAHGLSPQAAQALCGSELWYLGALGSARSKCKTALLGPGLVGGSAGAAAQPAQGRVCCTSLEGQNIPCVLR